MSLESALWDAFKIVISLAIGWALGYIYMISRIRAEKKKQFREEAKEGDHPPKFLRRKNLQKSIKKPESNPQIETVTRGDPRKA